MNMTAMYYECGICGHLHRVGFNGDCRQDDARFTNDQLDAKHGIDGWEIDETEQA